MNGHAYPQYERYKDSGVEWLGKIPDHWDATPLFRILKERFVRNTGNRVQDVLSLSYGKIVPRDVDSNFGLLPESFETYQIVEPGNIVLRLTDLQNDRRSLRVGHVTQRGIVTSAYVNLETSIDFDNRYAYYLLNAYDRLKVFYGMGAGVRQTMKYADLKRMPCVLPPRPEQAAIAAFLDRETARIDALIEKQERLIEKLEEKRKALISRAVTQGLNPNVKMRDSGVEWLGRIPEHWGVKKLKHVFQNLDYRRIPLAAEERGHMQGPYPYYGASGIIDNVNDYLFDETLLLVGEDGANLLYRSTPIAFIATGKYWVNNHAHILRPRGGDIVFLEAALQTFDYTPRISGAAQPKLTADALASIPLPLPPTEEQDAISNHLSGLERTTVCGTRRIRELIDRLRERRTALISAAVTGKIDVREVANG